MNDCPNETSNGFGSHNATHPLPCLAPGCDCSVALRKDAERYRKWRAAYTNPDGRPHAVDPMLAAIADAWTPEQLDAAIDAAPAVGAA